MKWDGGTKRFTQFSNSLILVITVRVHHKSDSVSRKQSAASKNQYNMSNRVPSPKIHAHADAGIGLI